MRRNPLWRLKFYRCLLSNGRTLRTQVSFFKVATFHEFPDNRKNREHQDQIRRGDGGVLWQTFARVVCGLRSAQLTLSAAQMAAIPFMPANAKRPPTRPWLVRVL